jgi:hypothetical protein
MRSLATTTGILLLASACASSNTENPGVERTDSAGVDIVTNGPADIPLDWPITEEFRLGGADSGPEAFYRVRSDGLGTDPSGNTYILDAGNFRVLKFDGEGGLVSTFGREGGGPGEFQFPALLAVSPGGEIFVHDYGKAGLVRFAPDGEPLNPSPWGEPVAVSAMHAAPSGLMVAHRKYGGADAQDTVRVSVMTASDTTTIAYYVAPRNEQIMLESCGVGLAGLPRLLFPEMLVGGYGDRMAVSRIPEYVVDVFEGMTHVASFRRAIPNETATHERAIAELGEGMRIGVGGGDQVRVCDSEEVVEKRGYAPVVPQIAGVAVAPDGTIWVQRKGVGNEEAPIDIIDPSGAYTGTLPAGTPFPDAFLPNGNLLSVERDELDVEYVVAYRVGGTAPE